METVNQYIAQFPPETQKLLLQVREVIIQTAPDAEESISYAMPAYKLNGKPLVYFAGIKTILAFMPHLQGTKLLRTNSANTSKVKARCNFLLQNLCL